MIRRRSTISIYDYPEHLNPFREERRESIGNKFRSFGQRGTSFRNAWNLLLPRSKRSQSFSRESSSSPPQTNYDTWTVRRPIRSQQEVFGLPASWTISPRRRYTPPNSLAGSPPRSPSRGSQLSVATLGVDVPSDERVQWQGARPKKKRAPLPPMSPTGSTATSSSTTSLRDSRHPEDTKDEERESLQVLVSRIQQEFGEHPESSRRGQYGDQQEKEPAGTTTSRVEKSLQVDKAFVVEPRVLPTPATADTAEEGNPATNEDGTSEKEVHGGDVVTGEQEDVRAVVDHSEDAPDNDAVVHEPQVAAKVFVETTSRTISSNGEAVVITPDDAETSAPTEPENRTNAKDKPEDIIKPAESQAETNKQDENAHSNDQNDDKSDKGSSVTSEDTKVSSYESSRSECQVETVSGRYESGAFVVSTPDTASVYEDAASEEDLEDTDSKTTVNGRHKPTPREAVALDSSKRTADVSNEAHAQVENGSFRTGTSLTVSSADAKSSETITSHNFKPKAHVIVSPRSMTPESTSGGSSTTDASEGRVSTERTFSNSLKHQTSFSVTPSHGPSAKVTHKNNKDGMETTGGNRSPAAPDIKARTNGDIRTPVTAPRSKSSNGMSQQTSTTEGMESSGSSSASTPTPPPRNKPQPVPRMKRLRKLFSNQ